jgi:hypothetical protein
VVFTEVSGDVVFKIGVWILDAGYWILDAGCWMLDVGYFLTPQKGNIAIYKYTKYFWVCVCGLLIPFVRTIMLCPSGARDPVTDIYCYRY